MIEYQLCPLEIQVPSSHNTEKEVNVSPNIWDSGEYGGFETTAVVEKVEENEREITITDEQGSRLLRKEYVEVYLRPVGQGKQLEYPYSYGKTTRKPSKLFYFVSALDALGIPKEGRPASLVGEVFTFQERDFEDLKFAGASRNAHRVRIPVKRWRNEAEALAYLESGATTPSFEETPIQEEATVVGPAETPPQEAALTPVEKIVLELALAQGTKSKTLETAFKIDELKESLSALWGSEIQKKLEAAGKLKIEERDSEEYYSAP